MKKHIRRFTMVISLLLCSLLITACPHITITLGGGVGTGSHPEEKKPDASAPAKQGYTKSYAIIIGASQYSVDPQAEYGNLKGPINDSVRWKALFEDYAFVHPNNIFVLNSQSRNDWNPAQVFHKERNYWPSFSNYIAIFNWIAKQMDKESILYICYSGHGIEPRVGEERYAGAWALPRKQANNRDPKLLACDYYSAEDFNSDLELVPGTSVVFVDSCLSGNFVERADKGFIWKNPDDYTYPKSYYEMDDEGLYGLQDAYFDLSPSLPEPLYLLTASQADANSYESDMQDPLINPKALSRGLFSYNIEKTVRTGEADRNRDGVITFFEIYKTIYPIIFDLTKDVESSLKANETMRSKDAYLNALTTRGLNIKNPYKQGTAFEENRMNSNTASTPAISTYAVNSYATSSYAATSYASSPYMKQTIPLMRALVKDIPLFVWNK